MQIAGMGDTLKGLDWADWLTDCAADIGDAGFLQRLGEAHAAVFRSKGPVLLVTFESQPQMANMDRAGIPLGWQMVEALGWSHMCLTAKEVSWFRSPRVIAFFDRLVDDGFFEEFDQVIFYGAGPSGYAAAAFSVAAPGARVLAIQPQATLDPRIAEWDDRFFAKRRLDFDGPYGYAPDMLDAAREAFVLYDPDIELDAMHTALFTRPNVTKFRMRFMGPRLEEGLERMHILLRMLAQLSAGKLNRLSLARLYRARHKDGAYQYLLLQKTTRDQRHKLTVHVAAGVLAQRNAQPFRKALSSARQALQGQVIAE